MDFIQSHTGEIHWLQQHKGQGEKVRQRYIRQIKIETINNANSTRKAKVCKTAEFEL